VISLDLDAMVAAAHRLLAAHGLTVDGAGDNDRIISPAITSARDVLALAAALETAERERDEAREVAVRLGEVCERQARMLARAPSFEDAMALCIHAIVEPATDAPNCAEWRGTMRGRGFVLSLQWADGKSPQTLLSEAMAERDTARSAHAELAAAVRAEREALSAEWDAASEHHSEMWAETYYATKPPARAATARLTALLAAAPPRSTVDARVVREYLAADAAHWREINNVNGLHDPGRAGRCAATQGTRDAARAALDAALAAATTTPTEGHG